MRGPRTHARPRSAAAERARADEVTAYHAMLLANVNEAILGLDEKFLLRAWNRAAERIYGWRAEEVLGKPILKVLGTQYHRKYDLAQLAQMHLDGRIRLEMRQVRKDGTPIDVEGVSVAMRDATGRITGFVAVNRDITDRRRAEEALRVSEERLKLALEGTTDAVWDLHLRQRRAYLSSPWAERLAVPRGETEEGFERLRALFLPPRGSPERLALRQHLAGEGSRWELETRLALKGAEPCWLVLRGRVVERGEGGRPVRLTGTLTDVTERKRMQAQLLQADRMASMGALAAGVAHEINNPLAYVITNLSFAAAELGAAAGEPAPRSPGRLDDVRRAVEEALQGSEHVRAIVRDLKTFSRDEIEPERAAVDIRRVLQTSINLARSEIRHRARLVTELVDVPPVSASEHRLGQVFVNLLINAAQAIPEGRVGENEVRVATGTAAGRVVIDIEDTGSGIPPEALERIFEPFYTTKPAGVGTGLGLSICHGIVSALGGTIEVESEVGRGTRFRVVLLACAAAPRAAAAPASPQAPAAQARARLLVVDDEPLIGRAIRRVLSAQHEVAVESSARRALARLEGGERFDVVLCDLMMPEMTGMQLHAEAVRRVPDMADRFVFLTGGTFSEAAREFLESAARPRIEKPFDPQALQQIVASVASRSSRPSRADVSRSAGGG